MCVCVCAYMYAYVCVRFVLFPFSFFLFFFVFFFFFFFYELPIRNTGETFEITSIYSCSHRNTACKKRRDAKDMAGIIPLTRYDQFFGNDSSIPFSVNSASEWTGKIPSPTPAKERNTRCEKNSTRNPSSVIQSLAENVRADAKGFPNRTFVKRRGRNSLRGKTPLVARFHGTRASSLQSLLAVK